MTNKNKLIIFIILAVVLLGDIILFKWNVNKLINSYENDNIVLVSEIQAHIKFQKRNYKLLSQNVYNDFFSIIPSQYLDNLPLLVYTYSGDDCNSCIFDDIESIKKRLNGNNKDRFLALPVRNNNRNSNISLKSDLDGVNFFRCDPENIKFPIDENNTKARYFAMIMQNRRVVLLFFPIRNLPETREVYLDFIFEEYLSEFN
jgi:hypothetical protein